MIEAKMMRMKGHAIHDAAQYVPKQLFEFWQKRDPIARFETYLLEQKKWLTREEHAALFADVDRYMDEQRAAAEASPMPTPEEDAKHHGVYCSPECHDIKPKYGDVNFGREKEKSAKPKKGDAAVHLR